MIRLFIYDKKSKTLVGEYFGEVGLTLNDIPEGQDFTLTPPPSYEQPWYWCDNKWQSEPKLTP